MRWLASLAYYNPWNEIKGCALHSNKRSKFIINGHKQLFEATSSVDQLCFHFTDSLLWIYVAILVSLSWNFYNLLCSFTYRGRLTQLYVYVVVLAAVVGSISVLRLFQWRVAEENRNRHLECWYSLGDWFSSSAIWCPRSNRAAPCISATITALALSLYRLRGWEVEACMQTGKSACSPLI